MVIEAVSSVDNKGVTPQITFGRRRHSGNTSPVVSTQAKAVPLAVLIALSPLNETKAVDIMHPQMVQAPTELAQTPQKENVIYAYSFKTDNFPNVNVRAVNTRGNLDGFDKIEIRIDGEVFEVKDVSDIEAYLLSANGVKEGPLAFRQVRATYKKDSKTYQFLDPNLTNYIAAVVTQGENKSNIRNVNHKNCYLIPDTEYAILVSYNENSPFVQDFLKSYEQRTSNYGTLIPALTKNVDGTYGNYKIRFYNKDNNSNDYETVTIQKDGDPEFSLNAIETITAKVPGIDTTIDAGQSIILALNSIDDITCISDDNLGNFILDIFNNDKDNKNNSDIFVEENISKNTFNL